MKLSAFIVTAGRFGLFRDCLASARAALPDQAEIVVVVNGPHPATVNWIAELADSRIRCYEIPKEARPRARNRAFQLCRGEIIYFLDDDVQVPAFLFREVIHLFAYEPRLCVAGGPNLTPPTSTRAEKIFGAIMTSAFAAPMVRARYREPGITLGARRNRAGTEHDLILCNLAVRRPAIPAAIKFPKFFRSNEENIFVHECLRGGLTTKYCPTLYVFHRRRGTLGSFLAQIRSYGFGRAQQTLRDPASCHPAFLLPALVWPIAWCLLLYPPGHSLLAALVVLHQLLSAVSSALSQEIRQLGFRSAALTVPLTGLVHLGYGLGFWEGVYFCLRSKLTRPRRFLVREGIFPVRRMIDSTP